MTSKKIKLEGLVNCRDLGGIKNKEGLFIKEGCLIRSNALVKASENDLKTLYDQYNLREIFDFRSIQEKIERPDPQYKDVKYHFLPMSPEDADAVGIERDDKSMEKLKHYFSDLNNRFSSAPILARDHMANFYGIMADSDYTMKQYGLFLKGVINAQGASLWHCSYGKDRCGIGTILVLMLLDVDDEEIYQDYYYTNQCFNVHVDGTVGGYMNTANKEYIDTFYNHFFAKFKSFDLYLKYVGITQKEKQTFKEKCLIAK